MLALLLFTFATASYTATAEPFSYELTLRHCRDSTSYVESRVGRIKEKDQMKRDAIIDEMWANSTLTKGQTELMIDLTRQYEYTQHNKWQKTFEYCLDNINSYSHR